MTKLSITPGMILTRPTRLQPRTCLSRVLGFNDMTTRLEIEEAQYWSIYARERDKLVVFSSFTSLPGYWRNPFQGEMRTEWGYPGDDEPYIGMHEIWDAEEMDETKRSNVKKTFWMCFPEHDTEA